MMNQPSELAASPVKEGSAPPNMSAPNSPSARGGRLQKLSPFPHQRSASAQMYAPSTAQPPSLRNLQQSAGAASPLPPPPVIGHPYPHSRSSSMDRPSTGTPTNYSRPSTPTLNLPDSAPGTPSGSRDKRKTGLFGKSKKDTREENLPFAWIAGHPQKLAYDTDGLRTGQPMAMPDMWDDADGNCYVYIFPRDSGKGPAFKIDSAVFASSPVLTRLAFGDLYSSNAVHSGDRRQMPLDARAQGLSLRDPFTPPMSPKSYHKTTESLRSGSSQSSSSRSRLSNSSDPPAETYLYLPVKLSNPTGPSTPPRSKDGNESAIQDLQTLIDIRNFFAFLCGQALLATEKKPSFFHIFMTISGILKTYEFSNLDGSTFGEVANGSFNNYVAELGLADVRTSREMTIEGIVLGERMRSVLLYNEAFTHGAGKHEELVNLKSPKFALMSSVTDNRLIRAAMDLDKRIASAQLILHEFDFPGLFTGIMSSKTSKERKEGVRFESWKEAFLGFRKSYLSILKHRYGDWPPKAKSKKNDLETSGLNRLVLRNLYDDMTSLYDFLVDRNSLTSRTVDGVNLAGAREEPTISALRAVLSEYDRSSPPVKPPVPFDLPLLPKLKTVRPDFGQDKKKDIKAIQKKLKDDDIAQILNHASNQDSSSKPFAETFRDVEKRAAHGCTISEIVDQRIGLWIFMYVVLQALPMLACDAPGLKWTNGVEYFLCEPPRKGVPWANPNAAATGGAARTWFSVGEGANVVSLPADVVEHGVEGIYRRSHCWIMAEKWTRENPIMNEALHEQETINAQQYNQWPPSRPALGSGYSTPPLSAGVQSSTLLSPDARPESRSSKRNSSLTLGLEALPLPKGVVPDGSTPTGYQSPGSGTPTERPKSAHTVDSNKTFDAILGSADQPGAKKVKKKYM